MPTTPSSWTRAVGFCLVLAPLLQVAEVGLSPLSGDTSQQLAAIEAHQTAFVVSVLCGLAATILYIPALVGLAHHVSSRSPRLSLVAALLATSGMIGFAGVRAVQGIQLGLVRSDIDREAAVALIDSASGNPIPAAILVLFMGGLLLGVPTLVIAVWRSGQFPKAPLVFLLVFVGFDFLGAPLVAMVDGRLMPVLLHLLFLAGLGWLGLVLLQQAGSRSPQAEVIPQLR